MERVRLTLISFDITKRLYSKLTNQHTTYFIKKHTGGSYPKNTDQFRNTNEFFDHGSRKEGMVNDTSFLTYYGGKQYTELI